MKKFLVAVMFGLMAIATQAEATFDQIEGLIQQQNYSAAAAGLEVIIQNHPKSAKAFYAMAQAQAGLGNLEKAQKALNIATGLNPTLDFAPASSVASLKQAITPQVAKIEAVEESHFWRNTIMALILCGVISWVFIMYLRKEAAETERMEAEREAELDRIRAEREAKRKQEHMEMLAKQDAERKAELAAEAALKAHKNYGKPGFDPSNPDKLKTKAQLKAEADEVARLEAEREARTQRLRAEAAEDEARRARMNYSSAPTHTTVVNNSSNDMLTGVMLGSMMSDHHHHSHDTTIIRETVRETPAPSRSSTWDDTPAPAPSRSSSWDDDSSSRSSSRSSSWDSDSSSSSSSSSWDSGSSSSDSSSSWD